MTGETFHTDRSITHGDENQIYLKRDDNVLQLLLLSLIPLREREESA